MAKSNDLDIEVHIKVRIREKDVAKVLHYAEEQGFGYGDDPGKKEIIRRLLISDGVSSMDEISKGEEFQYEEIKP